MLARHCCREPSHLHDPPWLNWNTSRLFSFFKLAIVTDKIRDKYDKRQSEKYPLSCPASLSSAKQIIDSINARSIAKRTDFQTYCTQWILHGHTIELFIDLLYYMNTKNVNCIYIYYIYMNTRKQKIQQTIMYRFFLEIRRRKHIHHSI